MRSVNRGLSQEWAPLFLFALAMVFGGRMAAQTDDVSSASTANAPAFVVPPSTDAAPLVPASGGATGTTNQAPVSSTYRLQPYDLIDVEVYNESDLHRPARLGADGTVLLPLVGSVKVGGMTVAEATAVITKKYAAGFVNNPNVMVSVLQYRRSTFSILGQVQRPGIYEIPEGSHVSIIQAISLAGGFTQIASQNAVTVKRTADAKTTLYRIKAADMAQNPDVVPFEILADDTVVVSAPQRATFSILGQVQRAGLYEIPAGTRMSIIEAVSLAGGYAPMAAQNGVTVKRIINGRQTLLPVKAADMAQDPSTPPFEVLVGDTIVVPYRNSTFSVTGQVNKPGIYEIPEGSHVNIVEAILMAGGYTRLAAQNSVMVKRTANGKVSTAKVHAGAMAKDANVQPYEVLPGDIVTVNESWY